MMFQDKASRRIWDVYCVRMEQLLSPLSGEVRRDLLEDVDTHVRDAMLEFHDGNETDRLKQVLDSLGDPQEFLEPMLAEAIFKASGKHDLPMSATLRGLKLYLELGVRGVVALSFVSLFGLIGVILTLFSIGTMLFPEHVGIYKIGQDHYQFNASDTREGNLVSPLYAFLFGGFGVLSVYGAFRGAKAFVGSILEKVFNNKGGQKCWHG